MPTLVHEFDWPDRVVVGTVGQPGSRTFYLQVRDGARISSVRMEKEQSAVLAERMDELLAEVGRDASTAVTVPTETPVELLDDAPLDQPVEEDFRTGVMRLAWDARTAQVVIEAFPYVEAEEGEDEADALAAEPREVLLVRVPVGTARAFIERTRRVVRAGRPPCPRCGRPVDPDGHECAPPEGR